MKSSVRKIVFLILLSLMTLLFFQNKSVYAGVDSNVHDGGKKTGDSLSGGPSSMKSGFVVSMTVADSENAPSKVIGRVAVLKSKGGQNIPKFNVAENSKFNGVGTVAQGEAPWEFPALRAGSNACGYGSQIINWLKQKDGNTIRARKVISKYCGVTEQQIQEYIAQGKSVFLNLEPVIFCNSYGNTRNSKGGIIVGTVYGIGKAIPDSKTYISSVTRLGFPISAMYEQGKNWQGIQGVSTPSQQISTSLMTNKKMGYGVASLKINDGLQVVIVCESTNGKADTEYFSTTKEWNIEQTYKGCKFEKATFSKKKTDLTDPHATYDAICSSGQPCREVGVGNQPFQVGEKALFILYKGEIDDEEPELTDGDLKSWETTMINPRYSAGRLDGNEVDNSYTLKEHIEARIAKIEKLTEDCPDNGEYDDHVQCKGHAVIDKITCNDNEDWENETYGISANLGQFPHGIWNLYRPDVSHDLWDTYANALGDTSRWTINEEVDPQFSYYLTRSHLEKLSVSPDREGFGSVSKEYNKAPTYDWDISYKGSEGASQQANSEKTHDVDDYEYTFTAYGYNLDIEYHFEHDSKSHRETEERTGYNEDGTTYTYDETTHYCEHPAHSWGEGTHYTENKYTPKAWKGETGGHTEDKFKTKAMPSGKNSSAGQVVESIEGKSLKGKYAKGGDFSYKAIKAQLVGSEFQGANLRIYPEIAMSVWLCDSADTYTKPHEELVYVMGEYARTYTPPIAHSFKCSITSGEMKGLGSLASAATGSAAKKVNGYDLGVTAMGTTFEVATKERYIMDIYTVGCTTTDSKAHSEWGNDKTDVKASHEEYLTSLLSGVEQELIMKMESNQFDKPLYYVLLSTEANAQRKDEHKETSIFWHGGHYDEESTVQGYCNEMWNGSADAYTDAFQYSSSQILDTMFVSCTDSDDDNNSTTYVPNTHEGTSMNGILKEHGKHWYDEESKNKMKVEFYHTRVTFGLLNADDKVDYNLLDQDGHSRLINAKDSVHVSFYTRLFNDMEVSSADGFTWGNLTGTFMIDQVKGTDFSVLNMTTSQMKK